MEFRVLGPLEVTAQGLPVRLGGARERLVLALLLLGADRLTTTERLIDAVWDEPPPTARQQLQNLIAGLRRRLGGSQTDLIATRPLGYELRMEGHQLDVARFRALASDGRANLAAGDHERAADQLRRALDLWQGEALADAEADGGSSGRGTVAAHRRQLHDERGAVLDLLLGVCAGLGRHGDVLELTAHHLAHDPWNEQLHEHRIRALAAGGRRLEAAAEYRAVRRRFLDDLGVPPGPALAGLQAQILRGDELGNRASAPRVMPRELPPPTFRLVGRDALLDAVVASLAGRPHDAAPPTVVLVGVGGSGKTALAVAAGHRVQAEHPDGTLHATLGPQTSADEVLARFLRTLGVPAGDVPDGTDARVALYRSTLAGRRVLVVLDGAVSEAQVRPLLPTTPGSAALVTSRRKLSGLLGARRHTVPALDRAASTELLRALAGEQRAAAEPAELRHIADLCGHLPLAVCVAGARLAAHEHVMLREFRERLEHEHARLDELSTGDIDVRACIASSVESLPEQSRTLFRRLSLAPATEWPLWVAGSLGVGDDWQRRLDDLVDRHLVEPVGRDEVGQARFRVHSLVSRLAAELYEAHEDADSRASAHRRLLAAWTEAAAAADAGLDPGGPRREPPPVDGGHPAPTACAPGVAAAGASPREWFEAERATLLDVVARAAADGFATEAAVLALRVVGFLRTRAYDDDREKVLRGVLAALPASADARLEVDLLHELFGALAQRRRVAELTAIADRQLEAARRMGDPAAVRRAVSQAGWSAQARNRYDEALEWFELSRTLAREDDDAFGVATANGHLGAVLRNMGRPAEADPLVTEVVEHVREHGSSRTTCIWLVTHAECLVDLGRFDAADVRLDEASAIAEHLHDDVGAAYCAMTHAVVRTGQGRLAEAAALVERARPVLDARSADGHDPELVRTEADLAVAQGDPTRAASLLETSCRILEARGELLELARDLARLEQVRAGLSSSGTTHRDGAERWRTILADLGLDVGALRLPAALYASATA